MRIIRMLDDFAVMVADARSGDVFDAFRRYTEKYPVLFKTVFSGLYMRPLDALRPMIENADFARLLDNGIKNRESGMEQKLIALSEEVAGWYGFDEDYDLYLGMELGNIGGFVGEPVADRPFMFIGLDQKRTESHFRQLMAHEFNHMVRYWKIGRGQRFADIDFTNRVIAEGLAVCGGAFFDGQTFSPEWFARHNVLTEEQFQDLITNETAICADVRSHFGEPTSSELNSAYLLGSLSADHWQKGYYYGAKMINSLVEVGYCLNELTVMPADKIIEAYDRLIDNKK